MNVARLLFALLLALPAMAQQPTVATEISLERIARESKEYLRDSAELALHMTVDLSATNSSGRVLKHRKGEFDYDFHGFKHRSNNAKMNLSPSSNPGLKEARSTAFVATLPSLLVVSDVEHEGKMKVIDSPRPDIFAVEFVPEQKCEPLEWMRAAYLFKSLCTGRVRVQLQRDDLSIKPFPFDAAGLPARAKVDYLGEASITGFHVDIDFQKATLPGDPKPFVVPWHVTVTVVTDKGKLVMAGEFALKK